MGSDKFVTAINCIDGRTQLPVIEFLKRNFGVNYVDMITEPGPEKILSDHQDEFLIGQIKRKINLSIDRHKSQLIAIVGHHDCAGNPVGKDMQIKQIEISCKIVEQWGFDASVIGLWVDKNWEVFSIESA